MMLKPGSAEHAEQSIDPQNTYSSSFQHFTAPTVIAATFFSPFGFKLILFVC
jgi:hypothetical protein